MASADSYNIWADKPMSETCDSLHRLFHFLPRYSFPYDETKIPRNGIYVLFEAGEVAHGTDRIVRIGTHTGNNQLRSRLRQHFVNENKDRSIFRKNIGRAFLYRAKDPYLDQWELDLTASEAKRKYPDSVNPGKQREVERRVTDYLKRNFSFVVFPVEEKLLRLELEARIISTVSWCQDCRASNDWLGIHSPKPKIQKSGLWQVNELYGEPLSEGYEESNMMVTCPK